ncbi:MAG: permease-like cell division protein FtsX [Lachnospiraceae bacterium]|nr:permease-like cell division protein FtsX [Lachnospiraceae bacterium]
MRISSLFYALGQGIKNLLRNRVFALASIATITTCLFVFGLFFSVLVNFRHIVQTVEEGVSITVFFEPGTDEETMLQRKVEIEERPEVNKVEYISAEQAWETFKVDYLGEYAEGFTENPLEDSANLEIYLSDVSKQAELVSFIEAMEETREVNYSTVTADTLTGANRIIAYVSVGFIALLFAVSVFLISNTISTGIAVRKEEINIMKYVGATDFFVRAPFVIEGLLIGVIGSVIPIVIIYFIYNKVLEYVMSRFPTLSSIITFLPVTTVFQQLVPLLLILGVGIGFIGSFISVRKHLRV